MRTDTLFPANGEFFECVFEEFRRFFLQEAHHSGSQILLIGKLTTPQNLFHVVEQEKI